MVSIRYFEIIGLKHHTSKLLIENLTILVTTFGFRGEALSSLCALANVAVITCTKNDAPSATKLELDIDGKIKKQFRDGAGVTVSDIFMYRPVRLKGFRRKILNAGSYHITPSICHNSHWRENTSVKCVTEKV